MFSILSDTVTTRGKSEGKLISYAISTLGMPRGNAGLTPTSPKERNMIRDYFCKTYKKMYESREKMRVDEIVDQVVGRSWLQGCPNICAATHFQAGQLRTARTEAKAVSFAVCRFFIWNSQTCWHCQCCKNTAHTQWGVCETRRTHLHKRGRAI